MRRLLVLIPLAMMTCGAGGDGEARPERYEAGLLKLASGVAAKEVCSCVFIMGRDEDFCRDWTRVSPDIAKFRVDYEAKTVRGRALFWRSTARYQGVREGCVLED